MKMIDYRTAIGLAVSLALCAAAQGREVPSRDKISFDITAPSLVQALMQFTEQSGLQLMVPNDGTTDLPAPSVVGSYTPSDALDRLLAGTALRYEFANNKTVSVRLAEAASEGSRPGYSGAATAPSRPAPDAAVSSTPSPGAQNAPTKEVEGNDADAAAHHGIPQILIRGSKSINADMERSEDDVQPYVVFDAEQIRQSQASTLEEFFKNRLPMNTVQGTNSQAGAGFLGNQSTVNLRGLGSNQTLILVDGRRMPSINATGGSGFQQPDINGIPLASIERIEVLPSTASGLYGGGATGGVINIITRKDYSGFDGSISYGNAFRMDAGSYRVDAMAGFSFEDGRSHVLLTASHEQVDSLLVGNRDFADQARARQQANNPAAYLALTAPPLSYTGNICAATTAGRCTTTPLVLDNGTRLNSNITSIPVGYAGPASDQGAALVANAGKYNLALPDTDQGSRQNLLNAPTINSAALNLRRSFGSYFEGFTDVSWLENRGDGVSASGLPGSVMLLANAPNNPFNTPIVVSFPAVGLSFPLESKSETRRAAGGLIVRLPANWTSEADYVWSRSRYTAFATNPVVGDPDGSGPAIGSATALGNGTLNVMRDLNTQPVDWSSYLLPSPNFVFGPNDTVLRDTSLRFSGPLLQLPGGPLMASTLAEYRKEEASDGFVDQISGSGAPSTLLTPGRSQNVLSYYGELRAPLVGRAGSRTLLRDLELQASVRRDRYRTEAPSPTFVSLTSRTDPLPAFTYSTNEVSATKYTLGLRYSPLHSLTFRASTGTGFLPPAIQQIVSNPTNPSASVNLSDPKRGAVQSTLRIATTTGGNAALAPEESKSWSAGIIFEPELLSGLRMSLDYTRIHKSNEIASISSQQLLDLEDQFPGRVTRDPLSAQDAARGFTAGVIKAIDATSVNIADMRLQAYDFQTDFSWDAGEVGKLQTYVVATWQPDLERQTLPGSPIVDSAGYSSGVLKWRGNAGVRWARNQWAVNWDLQYYDSYFAYAGGSTQATIDSTTLNQGSDHIPSQLYHDLLLTWRSGDASSGMRLLDGTEVMLGVQNVFNSTPPVLATTAASGGYSTYGDPRLRRFSLTVRKHF